MRMHRALLGLAIALASVASAPADVLTWKELGPAPITSGPYVGRVSAIAASKTNANLYYVGGADGGVWKTTDGGVTWKNLTDAQPTSAVGAIALDPTNENVVYVGTGEANYANHSRYGLGLLKSTDGGATWTLLASSTFGGRCFSRIVVDPQTPTTLYAAITPAGGFPEKAAAKFHPLRNGAIGVFKSTDGGVTWTHLTNGLPAQAATDLAIHPTSPGTLYAAIGRPFGATENGIYKSTNFGASWTKLGGGLPTSNVGRIALAIAPNQPARLYTLIVNPCNAQGGNASTKGAWRSDDNGATWTSIPVGSIQATYGWYLCTVGVKPTNANVVVMGGLDLVRSTNSGSSFSTITTPHVDYHAIEWDAAGRLLIGDDGGVHRSTNDGSSWSSLNNGLGTIQFYAGLSIHPNDPLFLLGGTQDNGTNKRTTNTSNWTQVLGGDGGWTQINPFNPNIMFAEYQGTGNLFRSTNGGGSFNSSSSGINGGDRNCFLPPYEVDPTSSTRALYATHRVYESTNSGQSWTAVSGDVTGGAGAIRALAIAPSNGDVTYVATNDGRFLVSTDRARTFTLRLTTANTYPRVTREITVHPTKPEVVYWASWSFGSPHIRRSTDYGATWQTIDGDLPDVPVNVIAVDARPTVAVLYAGTDQGVYRSDNGGAHWYRYGKGLPHAPVIDMRLDTARNRLVVATQGRGAWSVGLLQTAPPG